MKFLFIVYSRSRVFLLVATADNMTCLYLCCFESKYSDNPAALCIRAIPTMTNYRYGPCLLFFCINVLVLPMFETLCAKLMPKAQRSSAYTMTSDSAQTDKPHMTHQMKAQLIVYKMALV